MGVTVLILLFIVAVAVVNAGPVAVLLRQEAAEVMAPDGHKYKVQVGPTGYPWVTWRRLDRTWWSAEGLWLRQLRHSERTWTVTLTEQLLGREESPFLSDVCVSWKVAKSHFWDVVEGVKFGRIP